MPISQEVTGPQSAGDAQTVNQRGGKQGDGIVSELRGRYFEQTYRGNRYSGGVVGATTSAGLATTYTGLCLSNPIGSGVNLSIDKVSYAFIVAFTAAAVAGLATGYSASVQVTQTTPITPRNQLFNGIGQGKGLLASAATLPVAPIFNKALASGLTGLPTTTPFVPNGLVDLEGSLILVPGAYMILYTSTASGAASLAASFDWEESAV